MNREQLDSLQKQREHPSVSILLPTYHKAADELQQNPIRVKNLIRQAEDRLTQEVGKREAAPLLEKLHQLEGQIDYQNPREGLALFVNPSASRMFYLPFEVAETVVVDETFHTRHLAHAMNRTKRYYVLTLSRDMARLYQATRDQLQLIEDGTFPMTAAQEGVETVMDTTFGVDPGQYVSQQERVFFQHVDKSLTGVLGASTDIALVVVGDTRALGYFQDVSHHKENVLATVGGNYDKLSLSDLSEKVWPAAREGFAARRDRVYDIFREAAVEKSAHGLADVWRHAKEGRIATLLVEEDFHEPATVSEDGMSLSLSNDATASGALDDAVDEVVEAVLQTSGRVVFFESGALEKCDRIAAILRY